MKTKIFITGSSGFIGFHVAKKYLEKGLKVRGFDSMNNYYDVKLKKSRLKILKRYKKEKRFILIGRIAVSLTIIFLVILLG